MQLACKRARKLLINTRMQTKNTNKQAAFKTHAKACKKAIREYARKKKISSMLSGEYIANKEWHENDYEIWQDMTVEDAVKDFANYCA